MEECTRGNVEVGPIGADAVKTNYLRFDCAFERMYWVIISFVENGVCVCGFEVNVHLQCCVCCLSSFWCLESLLPSFLLCV